MRFLKKWEAAELSQIRTLPDKDNIVRLVTFDIPEKERRKRTWLRNELLSCDFGALHKSVFIGKRPLPQELIREIDKLNLHKYIHIVTINKLGTLVGEM